jgi:hypothetical protein
MFMIHRPAAAVPETSIKEEDIITILVKFRAIGEGNLSLACVRYMERMLSV